MQATQTTQASAPTQVQPMDPHAEKAMNWYGWGSPVGAGLFLVALSTCAVLLHMAGLWH